MPRRVTDNVPATAEANRQPKGRFPNAASPPAMIHRPSGGWTVSVCSPGCWNGIQTATIPRTRTTRLYDWRSPISSFTSLRARVKAASSVTALSGPIPSAFASSFHDALAIDQELAKQFPNAPGYRQGMAREYQSLGILRTGAGQFKEAEAAFRDALVLQKQLVAEFPNLPRCHYELGMSHNNLGNLLRSTGRPQDAVMVR